MQYLGGKSRIAKQVSFVLNNNKKENFVSLFCGTCSIESLVSIENKILNDSHFYLIECLKAMQEGRVFPDIVSEEDYRFVKNNVDLDPALSGFIGFGCSFGGKWWGGYARQTKGLNYAATARRSLEKKFKGLPAAKFYNLDYRELAIPKNSLVYCDPPYRDTTKYSNSKNFDNDGFWEYVREISKTNLVFVSELSAPEDFVSVWKKDFTRNLDARVVFNSQENLWIHK